VRWSLNPLTSYLKPRARGSLIARATRRLRSLGFAATAPTRRPPRLVGTFNEPNATTSRGRKAATTDGVGDAVPLRANGQGGSGRSSTRCSR